MANRAWWAAMAAAALAGILPRAGRAADSGQGTTPLADDRTLVALAVALACGEAPEASTGMPAPSAAAPAEQGPELELVATVRAKAIKFDVVPKTQVAFEGASKRKTVWKTERVNLPMHPQPGVVYHDVAVRLTITSDVDELAALLREAKRASAGIVLEEDAPASASPAKPADAAAAAAAPPAAADATPGPSATREGATAPSARARTP